VDAPPLLPDRADPASRTPFGLEPVFQQMYQKNSQAVSDFAAVAARHAFELLGDVLEVEGVDFAAARVLRLVFEPGDEIVLISGCVEGPRHIFLSS
jgi:hypothetical protein